MMARTDRHFRYLLRHISTHVYLYTEMVTAQAVLHGDRGRLLRFDAIERPVALQLGGDDPDALARCTRLAQEWGYDEVNLNIGCPSQRVQAGRFGACLMLEPQRVAACVAAMSEAASLPVTVKTRLGVDHYDEYEQLSRFVEQVAAAGCATFVIHARKAWLKGLSPRENRAVPPLDYERVLHLKRDFPGLEIVINGGIADLGEARRFEGAVDGVMIGRAAYDDPYQLRAVDRIFYGDPHPVPSREDVVRRMFPYLHNELISGTRLGAMTRHLLNLYHGMPGARAWRRLLTENARSPDAGLDVLEQALRQMAQHPVGEVT